MNSEQADLLAFAKAHPADSLHPMLTLNLGEVALAILAVIGVAWLVYAFVFRSTGDLGPQAD